MTRHPKKHHDEHKHEHHAAARKQPPHKDWRLWVIVGLMLAAMIGYIMSMDESVEPGGAEEPRVPAAP